MKSIINTLVMVTLMCILSCNAQIKNNITESVKIYGNCGMCKSKIEKTGTIPNVSKVEWNPDTKIASISFNKTKTSKDEILKKIALAGYDSDTYLAPDDVYANLPVCCQYDRTKKIAVKVGMAVGDSATVMDSDANININMDNVDSTKLDQINDTPPKDKTPIDGSATNKVIITENVEKNVIPSVVIVKNEDGAGMKQMNDSVTSEKSTSKTGPKKEVKTAKTTSTHSTAKSKSKAPSSTVNAANPAPLKILFDGYFSLKDALVKTDANTAANKSLELLNAIKGVKMESLSNEEHVVWMQVYKKLMSDSELISKSKDIKNKEVVSSPCQKTCMI